MSSREITEGQIETNVCFKFPTQSKRTDSEKLKKSPSPQSTEEAALNQEVKHIHELKKSEISEPPSNSRNGMALDEIIIETPDSQTKLQS